MACRSARRADDPITRGGALPATPRAVYLDEAATRLAPPGGLLQSAVSWRALTSDAPLEVRLLPGGAPQTLRRTGDTVQLVDADGSPRFSAELSPEHQVVVGDVFDAEGRRGEALDEIVSVDPTGQTTLLAYDWRGETVTRS